jgi:site-specific DNA-cytosine methylase
VFAIEHDADIAACYRRNVGDHVVVGDVATVNIAALPRVDVLWGSFPCQEHSVARSKALGPRADGDLALCILDYARILRPSVIVMENVPPWRKSAVYRQVVSGLSALGYFVDGQLVDASRFGVPQTRRRCIVRAVWGGLVPALPAPTPRTGWYAALEDLLPGLPESAFAPWQLKRLGPLFGDTIITNQYDQPAGHPERAAVAVAGNEPSPPVMAGDINRWRTFLVHNQISQSTDAPMVRAGADPSPIITTNSNGRLRAFLLDDQRSGKGGATGTDRGATCVEGDTPCFTVTAGAGKQRPLRAFLAHPSADNDRFTTREGQEPAHTITGTNGCTRAWLTHGRVVALTPRCLARLQTFPDSYELPSNKALAGRIVGNAVPPELGRRILAGLRHCIQEQEKEIA